MSEQASEAADCRQMIARTERKEPLRSIVSASMGAAASASMSVTMSATVSVTMSAAGQGSIRDNGSMPTRMNDASLAADYRLRKHADYQRVYREGRKQFSSSMSYFFALRAGGDEIPAGPRVGLTAGKVLGKAVDRNRIKRRMRDIVRRRAAIVDASVDIVLHPRRSVLTLEFAKLESEVVRIFSSIQASSIQASTIQAGRQKQSPAKSAEVPTPSKAQA